MKILTFDIEEWFHLLDFDATRTEDRWDNYESRIHGNVDRILDILERTDTKATFFIIGWVAKRYPDIVRKIASKYQIGSHTMNHQLVWQQTPAEFKADVESSVKLLEDIAGQKVTIFRAPGFSIRESEGWAFEILAEQGITIDCSVFPASHAHGGMPSYSKDGKVGPSLLYYKGISLKEFPISIKSILGKSMVFSGGGYFRLFPYWLIHRWTNQQTDYLLSYIHPRDLDSSQPMLDGLPLSRKFKSYVGLKNAESKLNSYLKDFKFTDIETADKSIDWNSVPVCIIPE